MFYWVMNASRYFIRVWQQICKKSAFYFYVITKVPSVSPFHVTGFFLYSLKTSEKLRFSEVFKGYRKRLMTRNGLNENASFAPSFLAPDKSYLKMKLHLTNTMLGFNRKS